MTKILAFGAVGPIAGIAMSELCCRGADVRAFVRKPEQAELARRRGASDVVIGDLADADSVRAALAGVARVFYVAPVFLHDQAEIGQRVVEQAIDAGVSRFVFSSVIHPVLSALPNHAAKAPVEEAVLDSDLEFAFLHPAILYQNYAGKWRDIIESGVLAELWSNETRHSRVDYRDVAEVAAIALTEDRLTNGTFELCADGWFNGHDVAAMIGKAVGRKITAKRIGPASVSPNLAALKPMFEHYDRYGLRGNALTLRTILGREPRSLPAFFEELSREAR